MNIDNHPACKAMQEITALKRLLKSNPSIAKQYGVEFYGDQHNMITIDNFLAISQKNSEDNISLEELQAIMPTLCKLYHLEYDGLFITLL